jgi:hypothetical protein
MTAVEKCHSCGQEIKQAHKETLNKKLLTGLQLAAQKVIATNANDVNLHDFVDDYNIYNNFQKLRYFGLIHYYRDRSGRRVRGHWLITKNGWSFLRGELDVHKWVKVRENHIVEYSPELINVRDVYRGSDIVVTVFQYFDENNEPVGFRPMAQADRQVSLI